MGQMADGAGVLVFDPVPLLTVTVESRGGADDIHLHAGGQGVWLARMVQALGVPVRLCCTFGGETGAVVRRLVDLEGIAVRDVATGTPNVAYVHDRRHHERRPLAEMPAQPLSRHEMDELYSTALVEGLRAQVCVLAGPRSPEVMPPGTYGRLARDFRANGRIVVADLDGEPLQSVIAEGTDVLKVSDEQLVAAQLAPSRDEHDVRRAMVSLGEQGSACVVVSRGAEPTLALSQSRAMAVRTPEVQALDTRGGGDSITAGIAAGLARGRPLEEAIRLGAAAGTLNVTRRGLGTGTRDQIEQLMPLVKLETLRPLEKASDCR